MSGAKNLRRLPDRDGKREILRSAHNDTAEQICNGNAMKKVFWPVILSEAKNLARLTEILSEAKNDIPECGCYYSSGPTA